MKTILLLITVLLCLFTIVPVGRGEPSPASGDSSSLKLPGGLTEGAAAGPIVITSDTLVADNKHNTATFKGSVKALKGDTSFFADQMVVRYTDDRNAIERIDADGNVRLLKDDNTITSEKAVYYGKEDKVVFTGEPVAKNGKNVIKGSKMVYYMKDERSVIDNSRVTLDTNENGSR